MHPTDILDKKTIYGRPAEHTPSPSASCLVRAIRVAECRRQFEADAFPFSRFHVTADLCESTCPKSRCAFWTIS